MTVVKDIPDRLKKKLTEKQYTLLMEILDALNRGEKPKIYSIAEKLGINFQAYYNYLEDPPFRTALRTVLENAIDIDTLIELKCRITNDDITTSTLAKLYLEKNKRPGGQQSFEDMIRDNESKELESEKEVDNASKPTDKPAPSPVSPDHVPTVLQ